MFEFVNFAADKAQVFFLVIVRTSAVFSFAPILGHRAIPNLVKLGFMTMMAGIIVATIGDVTIPAAESTWQLVGWVLKEFLVGAIITLLFLLIFYGVQTAGSFVGYQMGLSMANQFDPNSGGQVSIIGQFWYILATIIFIALNGHHLIITALVDSYQAIPPATVSFDGAIGEKMIKLTGYVFIIALKIASPVIVTLFLTDVALGTIAKTMPTMNVFFIGIPIKIGMGLLVMAISLPAFSYVLEKGMIFLNSQMQEMILAMGQV